MSFSYQPRLRGHPAPQPKPELSYPTYGEWFEMDGRTWIVSLYRQDMNMVQVDTQEGGGDTRFFGIAEWKRIWERSAG